MVDSVVWYAVAIVILDVLLLVGLLYAGYKLLIWAGHHASYKLDQIQAWYEGKNDRE
jgi:hypothetical protein